MDGPQPTYILLGQAAQAWADHAWGMSTGPLLISVRRNHHAARMQFNRGLPVSAAGEAAARLALLSLTCLSPLARRIVLACAPRPLQTKTLARRLGMGKPPTTLRDTLAELVERGVLVNGPGGYSPGDPFFIEIAARFEAASGA